MRSFVRPIVVTMALVSALDVQAQSPSPKTVYTQAFERERVLRRQLETAKPDPAPASLLTRVRSLVGAYELMSRRFPASPYMDNALWQAAQLASDAFWAFGDVSDKETALKMFSALAARFPTSSLVRRSPPLIKRLQESAAKAAPRDAVEESTSEVALTAIRREVLPSALRITVELAREAPFHVGRIEGPPRLFIDFDNTQAVNAIKDATIAFPDDVVRQVRLGRHADARTRVVMDLSGAGRHSLFALYNPYRVVVDFERAADAPAVVPAVVSELTPPDGDRSAGPAPDAQPASSPAAPPPAAPETGQPTGAAAVATPAPPASNASGGFSLSRQLGLGVSRIVIDPGHGGHDPGAKTKGLTEADLVLDIALKLERLLLTREGFEVVLTRRSDTFVPLEERTAIANRAHADLLLSIHANASPRSATRGVETYFLNLTTNPEAEAVAARENAAAARNMGQLPDIVKAIALNNKIDESHDLAATIQNSLQLRLRKADGNIKNLGVKQAPFMVLLGATMPSVLVEISFITNKQDASLLKTDKHRQRIAEALYAGVVRYQQSLKTAAPAIAEQ